MYGYRYKLDTSKVTTGVTEAADKLQAEVEEVRLEEVSPAELEQISGGGVPEGI